MKINFLRKIIITILLTTVIISCQFSSDSNQKQNYTPSPSFFWGTWIRMDNGLEYYIDEKKVVTENKEFQIDAKNSDSSTLKIKNMTEFEKQSDSVIINDGIPYFRKGGTDLKYTLKLVGFDNVINSSFRAASGTSLGGVKAKGQSGKYPSYTDENVSDDSGEITLISKTVDDENTVTIDTGDGVVVIPGIKIGNDGDFAGTIPLVGKDDYVLKITGEIPEEEKTDGYLYGNNFKLYHMKLIIKNISELTSDYSLCTITSKDANLKIISPENIYSGVPISTIKPGAEKEIELGIFYGNIAEGFIDTGLDIKITNGKTGVSWIDFVPLRFYRGLMPLSIAAKNPENNNNACLNGFIIYPDGNNQFFQIPDGDSKTLYVPTFLRDDKYTVAFCGATVDGELSNSTEMFYTVNVGSQESVSPVITGVDAFIAYGYGENNETEDEAYMADKCFEAYISDGELDYYKINTEYENICEPIGNIDTQYTVEYYQQNIDLSSYSLIDTKTLVGKAGQQTSVEQESIKGFHVKEIFQEVILPDGSSIVKIFYDRNKYSVSYNANGGNGFMSVQEFYYGIPQYLQQNSFFKNDCIFDGWSNSSTGETVYLDQNEVINLSIKEDDTINLYARWFYGTCVDASIASEMDLSNVQEDYTLKLKGTITNKKLQEVINTINKSANPITLDLSETLGLTELNVAEDGNSIFYMYKCKKIEKLILPQTLTIIGKEAFSSCSISSIIMPDSVTVIGAYAFSGCSFTSIQLSEKLTEIGEWAFTHCNRLTTITIPKSVLSIGASAFFNLEGLTSVIFADDSRKWTCTHKNSYLASNGYIKIVDVSKPALNASMLKNEYSSYIWTKN